MPKFRPSDICIGQNFESDTELNGVECEVLAVSECGVMAYHFRTGALDYINGPAYEVQWATGFKSWVREFNLRSSVGGAMSMKTYPFQISTSFNPQMKCFEIMLHVGGIDSKEELESAAKLLANFVAGGKGEIKRVGFDA